MKSEEIILLAAIGLLTVGYLSTYKNTFKSGSNMTLALRNKNPLNIRYNPANNWVGQTGHNSGFCVFSSDAYGYRAAFILLNNYVKQGFNTLDKVINRWAPPSDNNPTQNYINYVSDKTGLWPNTPIKPADYVPILEAMAVFEGGSVNKSALLDGHKLAFG